MTKGRAALAVIIGTAFLGGGLASCSGLLCSAGTWTALPVVCGDGGNCDTRAGSTVGSCQPIVTDCVGAQSSQQVCVDASVIQCGVDLVTETPVTTCMNKACVNGACTGTCTPATTRCMGNGVQTCDTSGNWSTASACTEYCLNGSCAKFASCDAGAAGANTSCGLAAGDAGDAGTVDCCSSGEVPGTTAFLRSYDGLTTGNKSQNYPANISGFRLDEYEVTVGRFRQFVSAVIGGG